MNELNVIVIFSDQHRRDSAGCSGHTIVQTPCLDRLAREGVRFERAYAASPICGPCRSATMTGCHVHRTGCLTHQDMAVQNGLATMGSTFRSAGYATGAFGKVHAAGEDETHDLGFDERALRIYTPMESDYQHAIGLEDFWRYCSYMPRYRPTPDAPARKTCNPRNKPIDLPEERILDHMVAGRSINFLERHAEDPFFLWVGFEKPHQEWYAPARFHALYDPADIPLPEDIWEDRGHLPQSVFGSPKFPTVTREAYSDDELRASMAAYYANISFMDEQVGCVLDAVDRLGLADNTIVVYASDHGDNLFNHGLVQKHCFFEQSVGVPLIVRAPGLPAGAVRSQLVSLIDLFPTLAELAGIDLPAGIDGQSRMAVARDDAPGPDAVFSEFYEFDHPQRMICTGRWKYVHTEGDIAQLFDLEKDAGEHINLSADPEHASLCAELERRVTDGWRVMASRR